MIGTGHDPVRRLGGWAGPLAGLAALLLWRPAGVDDPYTTGVVAGVAGWMAIWWMTEALPIAVTSLVPLVALPLLVGEPFDLGRVASNYAGWQVFLFFGGFLIAIAMEETGLHRRVALRTVSAIGTRPRRLVLGFMLAAAFLSMWISNTATALMMLPIGGAVVRRLDDRPAFGTALMLGIAYGASIGGVATPVGTPPNIAFMGIYHATFPEAPAIGFAGWMAFALPVAGLLLPVAWLMLTAGLRNDACGSDELLADEIDRLGRPDPAERRVAVVFVLTALAWIFRSDITFGVLTVPGWGGLLPGAAIDDGVVAMAAGLSLFLLPRGGGGGPVLDWPAVERRMPWGILLLFGGGFALADAIAGSGLSEWLGGRLGGLAGAPPLLVIAVATALLVFLTEVTSNTATAQVMLPLAAAIAAGSLGMHPLAVMLPVTVAASCAFMLPVATPPNAVVFGSGAVAMRDMVRHGLWLNLVAILILTLAAAWLAPLVFDFALGAPPPSWAR